MQEISGYIYNIIYRNEENAYTVFEVETEEDRITCVGFPPAISQGEGCRLTGEYTSHQVYGDQFRVRDYRMVPPETTQAMFRYLSSGAVKGIGAALARRIIRAFGEETIRIMNEEPERLSEVKGISDRKAREIAAQLEGKKDLQDAMLFLQNYGIGSRQALKIWKTYGIRLYSVLKENPYRLAEDIRGIGFLTADQIAARLGIRPDSEFRIRSGILYTMSQALAEGSTWLPMETVLSRTAGLLGLPAEELGVHVTNLIVDRKLRSKVREGTAQVYTAAAWRREQQIARMLAELDSALPVDGGDMDPDKRIRRLEKEEGIALDDLQRKAVRMAADRTLLLLSGGPGTGKTTTINTIIHYFEAENMDVLLAAPTGRAARRMAEATGREAMTIHRLLGVRGGPDKKEDRQEDPAGAFSDFEKDRDNPLEADAIIIDEMSMVDMYLMHALLSAILPGTRLIMVGDVNQLPSVGPGNVLRDLISSAAFPTVMLEKIFRQAAESDIVMNAHRILRGEMPRLDNRSRDFFFLERSDPQVIYKHMVELMTSMLPGYVGCRTEEIQVLTPMRKGALGVEKLNEVLQSVLNPPRRDRAEYTFRDTVYRVGDKVMQTRNNYQMEWKITGNFDIALEQGTGIFNGDCGRILEIREPAETMVVCFDDERVVEYPFSDLEDLDLAYAVTVHKSQGTEYPAVIMPLLSGPASLFTRNLLYTAVTRARRCAVILGSRDTVRSMTANVRHNSRNTGLEDRVHEITGIYEDKREPVTEPVPESGPGSLFSQEMSGL